MKPRKTLASRLKHRIDLLARVAVRNEEHGTDDWNWVEQETDIPAEVQDMLPSRAERIAEGIDVARRPCRIRVRYRTDVAIGMRLRIAGRTGEYRIVSQPAELGWREALEFTAEQLSTEGARP